MRRLARIGANSTMLPGVEIGAGALVGAGSVVVRDVATGMVVAGNPARVIQRVDELVCHSGLVAHPYGWAPYDDDESQSFGHSACRRTLNRVASRTTKRVASAGETTHLIMG